MQVEADDDPILSSSNDIHDQVPLCGLQAFTQEGRYDPHVSPRQPTSYARGSA